jgi:hypothetical protein
VHGEVVAGEDPSHGGRELPVARAIVAGADDHLVVLHPARAARVAVEEHGVSEGVLDLAEEALEGRVVGIVEVVQALFEIGQAERPGEDGHVAHGVRADDPTPGAHLAVVLLEVIAAAVHVDEHARVGRGEHGRPVLVQVTIEIAHKGVGEAVGEGLEPGLPVILAGNVGQGLRAVVRHAHEDGRARARRGMPDDRIGRGTPHDS